KDLDADIGAYAGGQHVDAIDDGLRPAVHYAGYAKFGVEFANDIRLGYALTPFGFRFEHYNRFDHAHGRVVGSGGCATCLAQHFIDLRYRFDDLVLNLENALDLSVGYIGQGYRHEQDRLLVEWWHKLRSEVEKERNTDNQGDDVNTDRGLSPFQACAQYRFVNPFEKPVYRVSVFPGKPASHEQRDNYRREGNHQDSVNHHNERFGICQRMEQLSLLTGEHEHGKE